MRAFLAIEIEDSLKINFKKSQQTMKKTNCAKLNNRKL